MDILIVFVYCVYFASAHPEEGEKSSQLHEPLLHDYQLTNEQILEELKGYLVYLVKPSSGTKLCGFLATQKEFVSPLISSRAAVEFTAKIQNPLTGQLDNYLFDVKKNNFKASGVMIAELTREIPKDIWPAPCVLSLTYIGVPVNAIIHAVGLDEERKPKLFLFKVFKTFDTTIRAERIDDFATEMILGEPAFYKGEFVGLLSAYTQFANKFSEYEFQSVYEQV